MAHISLDTIRKRLKNGGADAEITEQSTEESLQPLGSDDGTLSGELSGGDGAGEQQTDTANDVAGLGTPEAETKPKGGTKRVRRETTALYT